MKYAKSRLFLLLLSLPLAACSLNRLGRAVPTVTPLVAPYRTATPSLFPEPAPSLTPTSLAEPDTVAGQPGEIPYPLPADARDLQDSFGIYSFTSSFSAPELAAFYEEAFAARDYQLVTRTLDEDSAVLTFDPPEDDPITVHIYTNTEGERVVRLGE